MKKLIILLVSASLLAACEIFGDRPVTISSSCDLVCKKGGGDPLKGSDPAPDQTCVVYSFDDDSTLTMMHYNAGFNCCPEKILTDVRVEGDSLIITEKGKEVGCKCNCLFHVELKVYNLKPRTYHVRFEEDLFVPDSSRLVFDINLKNTPGGNACVTRSAYPWGL
ncbi:MAG: hypothetical protein V2A67_10915 [Bacteroidota bacterium]